MSPPRRCYKLQWSCESLNVNFLLRVVSYLLKGTYIPVLGWPQAPWWVTSHLLGRGARHRCLLIAKAKKGLASFDSLEEYYAIEYVNKDCFSVFCFTPESNLFPVHYNILLHMDTSYKYPPARLFCSTNTTAQPSSPTGVLANLWPAEAWF